MFFKMDDFLFFNTSGGDHNARSHDSSHVCAVGAEGRGASDHVTLHHVRWRHHDADELLQHHVVTWYGRLRGGHAQEAVSG